MLLAMRELRGVRLVRQLIAESMVPAPACCLDIGMAGERSWGEADIGIRKVLCGVQPLEIVIDQVDHISKPSFRKKA